MRILFLSDNFPPECNAPASRLHEHARYWVAQGHEVTVITGAPNFPEGKVFAGYRNAWRQVETMDGIRVVRVKTYISANRGFLRRTLDYASFMVSATFFAVFERRPDIVVATSPQLLCAVAGWLASVLHWRPFVFELRDLWPASIAAVGAMKRGRFMRLLERLELFLYRRADTIVAVTESFKKNLAGRGIARDKIEVVLNGADLSWCAPRPRDADLATEFGLDDKFVVGYLGTHGMAHGLTSVLEAAESLRGREDVAFFFAGGGSDRANMERLARERGLDNVHMIPQQPKDRVAALWSLCDLALIPLRDDPVFSTVIPSKLFEAVANGVPVLMSLPEGEATAIVHATGCGVTVPPDNPGAMAEAISALADDSERMTVMRDFAHSTAASYSRESRARQMAVVLEEVVTSSRHRGGGYGPARARLS